MLGTKFGGPLRRQPGERMKSYMASLGRKVEFPRPGDENLGTCEALYMRQSARLTDDQKKLFITSRVDEPSVIGYAKELERLYHSLHETEKKVIERSPTYDPKPGSHGYQAYRKPWSKGSGKSSSSTHQRSQQQGGNRYAVSSRSGGSKQQHRNFTAYVAQNYD